MQGFPHGGKCEAVTPAAIYTAKSRGPPHRIMGEGQWHVPALSCGTAARNSAPTLYVSCALGKEAIVVTEHRIF